MRDQISFQAGYKQGRTGHLPSAGDYPSRFAYVRSWAKGYREWAATREQTEVV